MDNASVTEERIQDCMKFAKNWNVILYNDDTTDFDFVVKVLKQVFKIDEKQGVSLAFKTQSKGKTVIATYPKKLAQVRVKKAMDMAVNEGFNDFKVEAVEE